MTQHTASNPTAAPPTPADLESQIQQIGGSLPEQVRRQRGGLLSRAVWPANLRHWPLQDQPLHGPLCRSVAPSPPSLHASA